MYSLTMEGENSTMKSRMSIEAVFVFVSSAWTKKKSKFYRFVFFELIIGFASQVTIQLFLKVNQPVTDLEFSTIFP
jgi:hypothetical protein